MIVKICEPLNVLVSKFWQNKFQLRKGTTPKFIVNPSSDFNSTVLKDNSLLNLKQVSSKSISFAETRGWICIVTGAIGIQFEVGGGAVVRMMAERKLRNVGGR